MSTHSFKLELNPSPEHLHLVTIAEIEDDKRALEDTLFTVIQAFRTKYPSVRIDLAYKPATLYSQAGPSVTLSF
jgi:hypothetical protein